MADLLTGISALEWFFVQLDVKVAVTMDTESMEVSVY
jgi:hypothetical protein